MKRSLFLGAISLWAHRTPGVQAAILIGSQARPQGDPVVRPDPASDWDFQLVVRSPADFRSSRWIEELTCGLSRGYVVRKGLWQGGLKVAATLADAEVDLLILPAWPLRRLAWLSALGWHQREGKCRRTLQALIHHVRPSWIFLKDAGWVEPLYRRAAELPDPRLSDAGVRHLAAEFRADCRAILRKLDRGELRAAQRGLHLELAEANFRLQHELCLRRGTATFEKGRRLEQLCAGEELADLTVNSACEGPALRAAVERAAAACRRLTRELLPAGPDQTPPLGLKPSRAIPAQEKQPEPYEQ